MSTVLVVDDKDMMRDGVAATLRRAGFDVNAAADGSGAIDSVARRRPDVVVTDLKMPGMTGLELLAHLQSVDDELPVIVMTAFGAVETAVQAIKGGAFDYITKPFEGDELVISVKRALEHARLLRENAVLRRSAEGAAISGGAAAGGGHAGLARLIGDSALMRRVKEQVIAVADSHGTVLICGESGTGKEVVARAVHELSTRRNEPFLALNCAALSESLLESELFGHEKGAFTGAERLRKGRFELADRGSLLLDEISEVSTRVQAKLLRVLQERAFERVGSSLTIEVDARVVATSNRDLPRCVSHGEFRQDLFFRLNVLPIHLPALRDRPEDIPALAAHFLSLTGKREGRSAKVLSARALDALMAYPWPGNVRELQNICDRAAVLCKDDEIDDGLIEPWLTANGAISAGMPGRLSTTPASAVSSILPMAEPARASTTVESKPSLVAPTAPGGNSEPGRKLEEIEREAIVHTLVYYKGHRVRAAKALGIGVRTLGLKLKKWKQQNLVDQGL